MAKYFSRVVTAKKEMH